MTTIEINGNVHIEGVTHFDLKQTLECGQCFRYKELGVQDYLVVAKGKLLHVQQEVDKLIFYNTTMDEYDNLWKNYFDIERDYGKIKEELLSKDRRILPAMEAKHGVRILNQEFFEMLITFIISQNKQIPHIMQIVERISRLYGEYIGDWEGEKYYSFPTPENLAKATTDDFLACKVGFRAKYLVDACSKVYSGEINEKELLELNYNEALAKLMQIKGVGEKVANCTLLFGMSRREAFPIDVWMQRIMETLYFGKETRKEVLQSFAKEQFGEYGGYAQQYLFYYARDSKLAK
jgi:N-glycosylase/DNA lyase